MQAFFNYIFANTIAVIPSFGQFELLYAGADFSKRQNILSPPFYLLSFTQRAEKTKINQKNAEQFTEFIAKLPTAEKKEYNTFLQAIQTVISVKKSEISNIQFGAYTLEFLDYENDYYDFKIQFPIASYPSFEFFPTQKTIRHPNLIATLILAFKQLPLWKKSSLMLFVFAIILLVIGKLIR